MSRENSLLRKDRRLRPRIPVNERIRVDVRLFGGQESFVFVLSDISETGILLKGERGRYPFNKSSILELLIYPDQLIPSPNPPVTLTAKFVRQADETSIAIRLSELDSVQKKGLQDLIDRLAAGREAILPPTAQETT